MKLTQLIMSVFLPVAMLIGFIPVFSPDTVFAAPAFNSTIEEAETIIKEYTDNINISDEVFYGKYNSTTSTWTNKGYLNYEKFEGLSLAEEAVKKGDYAEAKREVLEFYRRLYKTYSTAAPASPSRNDMLFNRLNRNNVVLNDNSNYTLWDIVGVGKTPAYTQVDVKNFLGAVLNLPDKTATVYLMSLKKDGSSFSFESRNAGGSHPPVIEITQKGVTTSYAAIDDATISPAENRNVKYGMQTNLLVEESVSSIGNLRRADKNTKRAMLKFDLSAADASAEITNAVLKLYGSNVGDSDNGEIIVMRFPANAWKEASVSWYTGDGVGMEHAVFSSYGETAFDFTADIHKDNEYNYCSSRFPEELLRFSWMSYYRRPYHHTKNEEYAIDFFRQWIGYLRQFGNKQSFSPGVVNGQLSHRYAKGLDGSGRDGSIGPAMVTFIYSENMTPDLWSATMKYLHLELEANLLDQDFNNNWRTFQVRGIASMLAYTQIFRRHNEFLEYGQYLAQTNFDTMIQEDGTSVECAYGYAISALNDMTNINNSFKEANMTDIVVNDVTYNKLKAMGNYVLDIIMPNMGDAQWGDSARGYAPTEAQRNSTKSTFLNLGRLLENQNLIYIGSNGASGVKPSTLAARYPFSLRYAMRTGWNPSDMWLFTEVDGGYSSHGHRDDNSIAMYAYGQYLLTDQAFSSYASGIADFGATRMHNTVEINNTSQTLQVAKGSEKRFATNNLYDNFTLALSEKTNPAAKHTRNTLFIKPSYWIVNDYMEPVSKAASNNYKQHWHMLPGANISLDDNTGVGRSNFTDTANVIVAQANNDSTKSMNINDGYFAIGTGTMFNSKYLTYEKAATGTVLFDTVLYPEKLGDKTKVETSKIPLPDVVDNGATAMHIDIDNGNSVYVNADYYLVHDNAQKKERRFGDYSTDGRSAYIEKGRDDKVKKVMVQDAKNVTNAIDGTVLFESKAPVKEFAAEFNFYRLSLTAAADVSLSDLTIYYENASEIAEVYFNDTQIPMSSVKRSGRYFYFGNEPILTDDNSGNENTNPSRPVSPGTNGHAVGSGKGGGFVSPIPTPTPEKPDESEDTFEILEAYQNELKDHWGKNEITELIQKNILQGIDDTTLGLENKINRSQFITLMVRILGLEPGEYQNTFTDISVDDWYAGYIQAAYDAGIADGVGDGKFSPLAYITREQMAKLIVLAYEYAVKAQIEDEEAELFADNKSISEWALPYVKKAKIKGLLLGNTDGEFLPINNASRAEAAVTIYRLGKATE